MTEQKTSNYDPFKAENPFLAMTTIGLHSATIASEMWLGAMRGFIDAAQSGQHGQASDLDVKDAKSNEAPFAEKPAKKVVAKKKALSQSEPKAKAPASVMAAKQSTDTQDDLKKISGVGPKLEQILNKRGFLTYADIAAMSAADMASVGESLGFPGRIERDDWVGQAKELMN